MLLPTTILYLFPQSFNSVVYIVTVSFLYLLFLYIIFDLQVKIYVLHLEISVANRQLAALW